MSIPEVVAILRDSTGKVTAENAPAILSSIVHALFRHWFRPLDPDYVSETACRRLLELHPGLYSLLEKAVQEQDDAGLRECDLLTIPNVELRTRRPLGRQEEGAELQLKELLDHHRTFLSAFANAPQPSEPWKPPPSHRASRHFDFISSLKLPIATSERPSLLLHDLGKDLDPDTSDILRNIFSGEHVLFHNAFGTGKTRLIFEGLCKQWGFYIPCALDRDRVGSHDLPAFLRMDTSFTSMLQRYGPWAEIQVDQNREIVQGLFSRVLLSRMIVFKAFLDVLEDKTSPEAPFRWLLLQARMLILDPADLFDRVTTVLSNFTTYYILDMTADLLLDIKARLGQSETPLFCVMDKCEFANDMFRGAFGSDSTLLRELARSSDSYEGLVLILSGSDMTLEPFENSRQPRYSVYTRTNALFTPDAQRNYVERYLPPTLAQSETGKELTERLWRWLRGRYADYPPSYGFTASYMTCLLMSNFDKPLSKLRTLKGTSRDAVRFFRDSSHGLLPGDWQTSLAARYALFRVVLTGEDQVRITGTCAHPLVEHGVARFVDSAGKVALVHEPRVLLRLMDLLFTGPDVDHGFYPDELLGLLHEAPIHSTFHLESIVILMHALAERTHRLSELFDFPGIEPPWATQKVRLVRLINVGPDKRPRAIIHQSTLSTVQRGEYWATDSAQWLSREAGTPFCLSSSFSNADLLFVLKLEDGRCFHVALAALFKNEHVDAPAKAIQAKLAQLAPQKLFKLGRTRSASGLRLPALAREVEEAGDPPLLRVVATYPHEMDINDIKRDGVAQPIAALRTTYLREYAQKIEIKDLLRRLRDVMTVPPPAPVTRTRKRTRAEAAVPTDLSKRPRTRSMTRNMEEAGAPRAQARLVTTNRRARTRSVPQVPGSPSPSTRASASGSARRRR
ncbi:hypothetical protein K525DRAFT_283577 [Schizophyllum commune Loenen D]|nr:hypothetical protein K525DRAFT_283577 [Schizophyllum commune Loenen D]